MDKCKKHRGIQQRRHRKKNEADEWVEGSSMIISTG
jgi:hypothetical protein